MNDCSNLFCKNLSISEEDGINTSGPIKKTNEVVGLEMTQKEILLIGIEQRIGICPQ